MVLSALLIESLTTDPVHYVSWVFTVVLSIVLHELGHGVAALSQGDDTPRVSGHMTLDPLVHMGGTSLLFLAIVGIAWGQMPVNPARFRSRHGDAIVAAAGPLVNLLLAFVGLTILGVWLRTAGLPEEGSTTWNLMHFFEVFGVANLVLCMLNLIPIPPLDGSAVLASFSRPYRQLISDPDRQGVFFVVFIGVFLIAGKLFEAAYWIAGNWVAVLVG